MRCLIPLTVILSELQAYLRLARTPQAMQNIASLGVLLSYVRRKARLVEPLANVFTSSKHRADIVGNLIVSVLHFTALDALQSFSHGSVFRDIIGNEGKDTLRLQLIMGFTIEHAS